MITGDIQNVIDPSASTGTKFIFFSGKGGVGKSTVSCATAKWLAEQGYSTLIVTTDPAPNIGDIFGVDIGHSVTAIPSIPNLDAIEIDPDEAATEYRNRVLDPLGGEVEEAELETIREQLDSPCVDEIAAFDKFVEFMEADEYDVVVFDTAPTGHTIRLMELPTGWTEEIEAGRATCIGPAAAIEDAKERYELAIEVLESHERSSFVFVGRPEETAIDEVERSASELAALDIDTDAIVVNGYLPATVCEDPFFEGKYETEQAIIEDLTDRMPDTPIATYPLQPGEITEDQLLADVAEVLYENTPVTVETEGRAEDTDVAPLEPATDPDAVMERLRSDNGTRYCFFAGKGGVGKSTLAAATGTRLAREGHDTLVVTTDPAAHLEDIFGEQVGTEPTSLSKENLSAARIDQDVALEEYRESVLTEVRERVERGSNDSIDVQEVLDQVREELNSPCAAEMAALEKFIEYFERDDFDIIIFDTAPTGHTLRLLELPSDWKGFLDLGSLTKQSAEDAARYESVIETMRDPAQTTIAFVMYPEYTPIVEAHRAAQDLEDQVGIETDLVAINYLLPDEYGDNAFFDQRREQQRSYLEEIESRFDTPKLLATLQADAPTGIDELEAFGDDIVGFPEPEIRQ